MVRSASRIKSGRAVLKTATSIESLMSMREELLRIRNEQEYDLMPVTTRKKKDTVWKKLNKSIKDLEAVATIMNDEMPNNFAGIKEIRKGKGLYE